MQLPVMQTSLRSGVSVYRLGNSVPRPGYHSRTQLWPVGYQATWQDAAAGTFQCDIAEGDHEGPLFSVSLQPAEAGQAQQVVLAGLVQGKAQHYNLFASCAMKLVWPCQPLCSHQNSQSWSQTLHPYKAAVYAVQLCTTAVAVWIFR